MRNMLNRSRQQGEYRSSVIYLFMWYRSLWTKQSHQLFDFYCLANRNTRAMCFHPLLSISKLQLFKPNLWKLCLPWFQNGKKMLQYYISSSTRNLNHGFREEQMQDMQFQACLQINNTFLYEYFMNKSSIFWSSRDV